MNNGGIHLKSKIYPDIAVFAKSIANGYAMSAIIGKRKIMSSASKTLFLVQTGQKELDLPLLFLLLQSVLTIKFLIIILI